MKFVGGQHRFAGLVHALNGEYILGKIGSIVT